MTVVITGGSGYIGGLLIKSLLNKGYTVIVVDIVAPKTIHEKLFFIPCDLSKQKVPFNVLDRADAVINLIGKNILSKWTDKIKLEIKESRVNSTKNVVLSLKESTSRPPILINASAVGFYGERGNELLTESSVVGSGFFSEIVYDWENIAMSANDFGTRVVCMRTAPVLGQKGIVATIKKKTKIGIVSLLAKKNFWQPWVHEQDVVNAYIFALETSTLQGPVNLVSPEILGHREFMKQMARYMKRVIVGHIPKKVASLFFGDLIDEITKNQKVVAKKLTDKGFVFEYPTLDSALKNIFQKK